MRGSRLLIVTVVVLPAAPVILGGCRVFAADVPCLVDDNCPSGLVCVDERCGIPAPQDIDDGGPDDLDDAGPDPAFTHEHVITVTGLGNTEELVGFPVLVRPGDDVPAATALAFFDEGGAAALPFEVARWGDVGEREIWVGVPAIHAGQSAQIVMRRVDGAGFVPTSFSPATVWDGGFFGVWHLGDDIGGGVARDSTARGLDGVYTSMGAATSIVGLAGHAVPLDGVDDHVRVQGAARVDLPGAFTVEAWVKTDRVLEQRIVSRMGFENARGWQLSTEESRPGFNGVYLDTSLDGVTVERTGYFELAPGDWLYVAGVFVPSTRRALVADGILNELVDTNVAASQFQPATDLTFGITPGGTNALQGVIDEVRISTVERSESWLRATHRVIAGDVVEIGAAQAL